MRFIKIIPVILLAAFLLCACHNGQEQEHKKGVIKTLTDKTAHEAVKAIKTPIDKARAAAGQEEKQGADLKKALEK